MDGYFEKILHKNCEQFLMPKKIPATGAGKVFGWLMGLEPTTLRTTI